MTEKTAKVATGRPPGNVHTKAVIVQTLVSRPKGCVFAVKPSAALRSSARFRAV